MILYSHRGRPLIWQDGHPTDGVVLTLRETYDVEGENGEVA